MKKSDKIKKSEWLAFWGIIIAALIGAGALILVNYNSNIKKTEIFTSDQSTVYHADRDLIINPAPIHEDVKSPPLLGILEFDSNYKKARSYMLAGDYKKAVGLFKLIYEIKPDYPTLALHYGECLAKIENYEEALAVWLSIPSNENYNFINLNIGVLLYKLNRYKDSSKYCKLALKDFKKSDCRYWVVQSLYIETKNKETSIQHLINDVNNFVKIVDNDLKNLYEYEVKKGTVYEIDNKEVVSEILSRKISAFYILTAVSQKFFSNKNYSESLAYELRAADYLDGPANLCNLIITKQNVINFLRRLNKLLRKNENKNYNKSKLNSIMERIEKLNNDTNNQEISDFAVLIRLFFGDSNAVKRVKRTNFKLTYSYLLDSPNGLDYIDIMSSDYLLGRKKIDVGGNKKFNFKEIITINPKVILNKKPVFRIKVKTGNNGFKPFDLYPLIEIIE